MPTARSTRLVCNHCAVALTPDDREHYGYQCHACVVHEHELVLTWASDPEHPGVDALFQGPVDLGLRHPRPFLVGAGRKP